MTTSKNPICQYVNDPSLSPAELASRLTEYHKLDPAKCIVLLEHRGQFFRNGYPIEEQTFRQKVRQASKAGTLQTFNMSGGD